MLVCSFPARWTWYRWNRHRVKLFSPFKTRVLLIRWLLVYTHMILKTHEMQTEGRKWTTAMIQMEESQYCASLGPRKQREKNIMSDFSSFFSHRFKRFANYRKHDLFFRPPSNTQKCGGIGRPGPQFPVVRLSPWRFFSLHEFARAVSHSR